MDGAQQQQDQKHFNAHHFINFISKRLRGAWRRHKHRHKEEPQDLKQTQKPNKNSVCVTEDNYDYVEEDADKVSSDISLYQCEMPAEKIKRLKAKQDSLSRLKDLPLGVKSLYPTINTSKPKFVDYETIIKRPVLVSAEVFERSRNGDEGEATVSDDYLDMEDPPNYDDFMYLRWEDNKPETETSTEAQDLRNDTKNLSGTPPPPYSESVSSLNYMEMVRSTRVQG